jgi:hypothetical protein
MTVGLVEEADVAIIIIIITTTTTIIIIIIIIHNMGSIITTCINCEYRIAAKVYTVDAWCLSGT